MKFFEVRDRGTYIPVVAFTPRDIHDSAHQTTRAEVVRHGLQRSGFAARSVEVGLVLEQSVIVVELSPVRASADPYDWPGQTGGTRTMAEAHRIIESRWHYLRSGEVIDVEFHLGETKVPKVSEVEAFGRSV